jgi:CHASE3 domain sensor protein
MSQRRYRWDQGLRLRVLGLLALLIVVMVALGATLTASFDNFTSLQQRTEQTRQNVLNMERAIGTFAEMTSDLRGYILTGQEQFMQPYVANQARMDALLVQLREASQGNAEQSARVLQVGELADNWRTQVAEPEIAAVRARSGNAGHLITSGVGPNYIDEIRQTAETYNTFEQTRLQKELDTVSLASSRVKQVVWFGAGLASLLALGGFWIFARSVTRSTTLLAAAAEKIAQGERGIMVDVTLQGEFQVVAQAFSSMSMTLAAQEEELQAQQEELIAQNEELLAQQDELQDRAAALEKQDQRVSRLNRIGQALIGSIDIDQVSSVILDEYLGLYGGSAGLLLVTEPYSEQMVVQAERWVNPAWLGTRIKPAGQLARAAQRQEVVLAKYPETSTRVSIWQEEVPVVQEVYVPLVHATRVIGIVVVAFSSAVEPPEEAVALNSSVAHQGAVALAAALSHQEVRKGLLALQEQAAQVEELNAQLEEERDRTSAQLDIYLSIVSTMRPGAWLTDTAGNLLVVNATFQEFFGEMPQSANLDTALAVMAKQLPAGDPFLGAVKALAQSADDREGGGTIQLNNGYVLQWSSAPALRTMSAPSRVCVGRW